MTNINSFLKIRMTSYSLEKKQESYHFYKGEYNPTL